MILCDGIILVIFLQPEIARFCGLFVLGNFGHILLFSMGVDFLR